MSWASLCHLHYPGRNHLPSLGIRFSFSEMRRVSGCQENGEDPHTLMQISEFSLHLTWWRQYCCYHHRTDTKTVAHRFYKSIGKCHRANVCRVLSAAPRQAGSRACSLIQHSTASESGTRTLLIPRSNLDHGPCSLA